MIGLMRLLFALAACGAASLLQSAASPSGTPELAQPYSLPRQGNTSATRSRAAAIGVKRATFLYGPGIAGGPWSATGPLAATYLSEDLAEFYPELTTEVAVSNNDSTADQAANALVSWLALAVLAGVLTAAAEPSQYP